MTDETLAHNLGAVAAWTDQDWTHWFFRAFREHDHRPLRIPARATPTPELEELYAHAPEDVRQRMQSGLFNALRMWDEEFYGLEVLAELSWTAAKIRAVGVVPVLIKILLDNREQMGWGSSFFDTADLVLAVLTGFAVDEPGKRIESAFDALFHDSAVAPHFSALLALGISICNPERFVEAFDRFVERSQAVESYFARVDVITQFAEHLTAKRIRDKLDLLSPAAQEYAWTAGIEAGIFKRSELTGLAKDSLQKPLVEPLPFRHPPESDAFENASRRFRIARGAYKGASKSVLDATGRALKRIPQRGRG